jgi:hypothetical protein
MAEEKKGFFKRLKEGLSKTRNSIVDSFSSVFEHPILMMIFMKNWKRHSSWLIWDMRQRKR